MESSEKALASGMIAAVIAALIAGIFAYKQQRLETESRTRAKASELRVRRLESQTAELRSHLVVAKQLGEIQGNDLAGTGGANGFDGDGSAATTRRRSYSLSLAAAPGAYWAIWARRS